TQVTKVNGVFESESVVSDTVTIEPVKDIVVVGNQ
ncbi:MAG: G5 domain-containing protein, partial [Firmicutes bacterium]|nr:G5 domain-containing protein [Bacillota bacterium]